MIVIDGSFEVLDLVGDGKSSSEIVIDDPGKRIIFLLEDFIFLHDVVKLL